MNDVTKISLSLAAMVAVAGFSLHMADQKPEKRLVGFGCGTDQLTLTAYEEDEFPVKCFSIETVEQACGRVTNADGDAITDAEECAAYWGDGY